MYLERYPVKWCVQESCLRVDITEMPPLAWVTRFTRSASLGQLVNNPAWTRAVIFAHQCHMVLSCEKFGMTNWSLIRGWAESTQFGNQPFPVACFARSDDINGIKRWEMVFDLLRYPSLVTVQLNHENTRRNIRPTTSRSGISAGRLRCGQNYLRRALIWNITLRISEKQYKLNVIISKYNVIIFSFYINYTLIFIIQQKMQGWHKMELLSERLRTSVKNLSFIKISFSFITWTHETC
jgi:hypothetical protein